MEYGFSLRSMREMQRQKKAANQQAQKQYLNRGAGQESNLQQFQALYDADQRLMAGNSVDASSVDPQQFTVESERAGNALLVSLKNSGHEFSDKGVKKFIEYLGHHYVGDTILDTRRADVLCAAFNRASQIGLFTDGDFVSDAPAKTTPLVGRAREDADRAEYLRELRAELGDHEYEGRYRRNGQHPLGARRPNDPV